MNLPNKLTVGRMIAVPFFVAAFMIQYYMIAFIIFLLHLLIYWTGRLLEQEALLLTSGR